MAETPLKTGVALVAAERQRQVDQEGWTPGHDDEHRDGELALAAICYAAPDFVFVREDRENSTTYSDPWPFEPEADKRRCYGRAPWNYDHVERVELLIKAGALIAAEIDRLQRRQAREAT